MHGYLYFTNNLCVTGKDDLDEYVKDYCVKFLMQRDAMLKFLSIRLCLSGFEELEALFH